MGDQHSALRVKLQDILEGMDFQFRLEAFNVWNHTNFSSVDTTLGSDTFGQITNAHDPRILQLGLKLNF